MPGVRVMLVAAGVASGLLVSCGGDDRIVTDSSFDGRVESRGEPIAAPAAGGVPRPAVAGPRLEAPAQQPELEQAAVWPAADVVFETPEEAAADFVDDVMSRAPEVTLGEYQGGDSLSGEIEVLYSGQEGGEGAGVRSRLLMRKLLPSGGWFVVAAVSEATITSPACCPASAIAAGPLTVEGVARGHEATIGVSAFPAGDADAIIDRVITSGGLTEPAPYTATLDLTSAAPGSTVVLVRTDAALTNDPGQVSAIPVTVVLPATR